MAETENVYVLEHDPGIADRCCSGSARAAAIRVAEQIAKNSPAALALSLAKRSTREGRDLDLAGALDLEDEIWRTDGVRRRGRRITPRPGRLRREAASVLAECGWPSAEPQTSDGDQHDSGTCNS